MGVFPKTRSANRNKSEENGEIGTNRGDPPSADPKGPPEIIQKFRPRKWPISSADFPMTPMERAEHHFGPFREKDFGAISGGPLFSRRLWFTAEFSTSSGKKIGSHLVASYCAMLRDYLSDNPLLRAMGVFWCLNMANWVRYPFPFSERFPLGEHAKWRCDTPPSRKGVSQRYLRDTT